MRFATVVVVVLVVCLAVVGAFEFSGSGYGGFRDIQKTSVNKRDAQAGFPTSYGFVGTGARRNYDEEDESGPTASIHQGR